MPRRPDPASPETPIHRYPAALSAVIVMGIFLAVLWVVQIADSVSHYPLLHLGIEPRSVGKVEDIFTAPFIHVSYAHLIGNTLPLLVLGFFVALRGIKRFLLVTLVIIVVSGLGVWLTASSGSDTVGASGVIFGYFGYLVARGVIERRPTDLFVGVVVGALYWSILPDLFPGNRGVSWQAHLFGLLGGILAARLFRLRREASGAPGALRPGESAAA